MKLTKAQRAELREMFGGRCAYCGSELGKVWHADHVEAVIRSGGRMERAHNDRLDNFMPSCPPCNIDKHRMSIEHWREWLGVRLGNLQKQSGFKLLKAHGLVTETGAPIVFYFEKVSNADPFTFPRTSTL